MGFQTCIPTGIGRISMRMRCLPLVLLLAAIASPTQAQPFTVQGPGVNPANFRVTTFASGLSYPMGMAQLADGSLLVTVVQNNSFFSGTTPGRILRLTDTNQNGIADDAGTIVFNNLPPSLTALRVVGNLVFVTGPPNPIQIFRLGATPAAPLTLAGRLIITYPVGWTQHQHSELLVRKTPGFTNRYDVFFQIGASNNFATTTIFATLTNDSIAGAAGTLSGDAIHCITIIDNNTSLAATNLTQIATGVRNPAGFTFHPTTWDFYFEDNGIDGATEAFSADELNMIARTNLGGPIEYFGFPSNYVSYRTNVSVGGAGIQPLMVFQPIPNPFTGRESEGANQIVYAPPGFPDGLNAGIFIGFHGKFSNAGVANEENPVIYADPISGDYFHFIPNQQPGVGHLDSLLATRDSLFVADMTTSGNPSSSVNAGAIYQIKSLVTPSLPVITWNRIGSQMQLSWNRGRLQSAPEIAGPWSDVAEAFSPLQISTAGSRRFYRTVY